MTDPASPEAYPDSAQGACLTSPALIRHGLAAGLAAGIIAALYQSNLSALLDDQFFMPARLVAAMLLGPEALNRWYSLFTVVVVGMGIHVLMSLLFGMIFGWLLLRRPQWRSSPSRLLAAGVLYGIVLWCLNFYLIAPLFNWIWFIYLPAPIVQGFLGHAFFFGAVLALYITYRCRLFLNR